MKLYNTASQQIEEFKPLDDVVKLYACGPTVYDYTHLGHLRKYMLDDVLIRVLRHAGYEVKHVQNITDVGHLVSDDDEGEDKLEKGSRKYGESAEAIARRFEDYFFYSMDLMGVLRPTLSCRATDHIQAQLELVKDLEAKGFTYVIEGDGVYFDTSKIDDYGKLMFSDPTVAKEQLTKLKEGARVAKVIGRRQATDFALWKFEKPGENRQMVWPSPWFERSFPGWHVECSAMSIEHLGPQLDIHTGGVDHIAVHHSNEIAQSEAFTGKKPFAKYWVHHNFLRVDNEKMSKSLGNFYTIDDVLERGYAPQALRLLFLMGHYRSEQNFTWDSLTAALKAYFKLARVLLNLRMTKQDRQIDLVDFPEASRLREKFFSQAENDLHLAEALAVLWELLKSDLDNDVKYRLILEFDQVMGLGLAALSEESLRKNVERAKSSELIDRNFIISLGMAENEVLNIKDLPARIQDLVEERQEARALKDWGRSDALRDQLQAAGYDVVDQGESFTLSLL